MWKTAILVTALFLSGCVLIIPVGHTAKPAIPDPDKVESPGKQDQAGALLNAYRKNHGLNPVWLNSALVRAARQQSADMRDTGKLVHVSKTGEDLPTRVEKHGYSWCHTNENIAMGYQNYADVIDGWHNSPKHRVNLQDPKVTEYGLVRVEDYYTLIMASRC